MGTGRLCPLWSVAALVAFAPLSEAPAEISTDGTVGPRVQLDGPEFAIGADLGTRAGGNLFHSFERFSLGPGERATFSGPDQIGNVISRVTGGERSDIDGTIRSTISGADFYFINPAGIVFGPDASLDVLGSFHVSTADELRFRDGATFSATDPAASSFTVAAPEAFGFLGSSPAAMTVDRSVLEVPSGQALSLVGGDIEIRSSVLTAPAGELTVLALSAGEAQIGDGAMTGSAADVGITASRIEAATQGTTGTIRIAGDRVRIENQTLVSAHADFDPESGGEAGSIAIDAADLIVDGATILATAPFDGGGVVLLRGDRIQVVDHASISVGQGLAPAGLIAIDASDLSIANASVGAGGPGGGGTIAVRAGSARIMNEASVSAGGGPGAVGSFIVISVADLTIDSASIEAGGPGAGGAIRIDADQITIRNGRIDSTSIGFQRGGEIVIFARQRLEMDGGAIGTQGGLASGGGRITIAVGQLLDMRDSSITSSVSGLPPFPSGANAGDITIDPPLIVLDGSRIIAQATEGTGGNINIVVESLIASPDSVISASAGPAGIDGTVVISTPEIDLSGALAVIENAIVDTEALRESCAARRDVGASSFTEAGRGGLPPTPDAVLFSPYVFDSPAPGHESTSPAAESNVATEERRSAIVLALGCDNRDL